MKLRQEQVTVCRQKVVNGCVVATVPRTAVLWVYGRKDGTEFVKVDGKRCQLIKGVVVLTI